VRWRAVAAVGVAAALVAAGVAVDRAMGGAAAAHPASVASTTSARVVRSDLAETTPVNGTVGYASPVSLVEPAGTPSSALTQAEQAAASAAMNVTSDQTAVSDTNAANAQAATQASQGLSTAQATATADANQLDADEAALAAARQKAAADCQGDQAGGASPSGTGASASSPCAADAAAVTSDEQKVATDQQKVTADQASVQTAQGSVASAQQHADQNAHQAQAKLGTDELALATAHEALDTAQAAATSYGSTSRFTSLPTVGQVIRPGQSLWAVDGSPVVLLPGSITPWRAFAPGMSDGADVAALDAALIAVGDGSGLTPSDSFTGATATAIERLQASLGVPQTGSLPLGSVIFRPTPVRVTAVHSTIGAPVQGGAPVLDVTSTTPIVNVALSVQQTYLVKTGDAVTVQMPDGTTAKGTITAVGSVATNTTPSSGAGSNTPSATVNVTVSLINASPTASLDQAPVTVNITNNSAHAVLAVPVAALLALGGGGYAVEVVAADGTHHLVGVTTGLFDDQAGLVQVSGGGLAAGQTVVVAA
jgi:multidrug efflux pump subunit AcrA (membrane-fusion protein)